MYTVKKVLYFLTNNYMKATKTGYQIGDSKMRLTPKMMGEVIKETNSILKELK